MAGIQHQELFDSLKSITEKYSVDSVIYELSMVCADSADPYKSDAKRLLAISDVLYELVKGETLQHSPKIGE